MASVRHYIQRIKEGRLKQIMGEVLWMYAYVRRYWLLIGVYILLGASGSVLGLGTSVVSKDLVDAITGVNSMEIVRVAGTYVGVGVSQIFINAVKSRLSLKVRLKVTNEIRGDIYEQVLRTNWESLAKYRSGDLLYRVNGDAGMVANTILTFLPNVVTDFPAKCGDHPHQFRWRFCHRRAARPVDGAHCPYGRAYFLPHLPVFGQKDAGVPEGEPERGQRPHGL